MVREMQECTTVFISQEKDKEQSQKCKENMLLKTYLSFVVIQREHVGTQRRQGMLAREHVSMQGT